MEGQVYKFEVSRRKTGDLALEPIMNGQQACEFCFKHIDGLIKEWRETSVGIYLDKENRALGYEVISEGTADACLFDTKQLIRSACLVGANSVIVAHNHPSGNCRPSKLDIEQAEKIRRGLHAAGLILLDFVIMTESGEGYTMCDERVIKCEKTPENVQETQKKQKPAEWSDNDENSLAYLHELIDFGIAENFFDAQTAGDMKSWVNMKLSSIHSQPHWKPSEEQIDCLQEAIEEAESERLYSLQEKLIDLMESLKKL